VDTINAMTQTLGIFAEQVTTVAREVGTEGKLGGQAQVPGVSGTWKDLTDNVNYMANSLTVQVRAISDVATAVTEGDLTRSITVEAQGEVAALKNNINQMIANLKDTTQQNMEQDWLKTNLARFSGMMQGQKTLESVSRLIMSELTPLVGAHAGVFYLNESAQVDPVLKLLSSYAYQERKSLANRFRLGEGLVGQCALEKKSILVASVPSDYIHISSGLGDAPPMNIIVLPVLFEGDVLAVIELASFQNFSAIHRAFLDQLMESIGVVLNMISANMRTEELLQQSQSLTQELQSQSRELQSQQDQLKRSNIELEAQAKELEEKARQLAEQNIKVEQKNREVELARAALEEKAEQLALSSKYKSEFLANMSHELRTPLNSMLILAKLLAENGEGNLQSKQVEFARTIYAAGGDLLNLINEILDLSKIESGKMEIDINDISLLDVDEFVERNFRQVAQQKGLGFDITIEPNVPPILRTDAQRLQQVLKNLLSNAFKFTEKGRVELKISQADRHEFFDWGNMDTSQPILAFSVIDTGIGIAKEKQSLIFEAFQQADGTTNRRYGGTGLGLSISRELTRLLGGRIRVVSVPGEGSTFTLYLPQRYSASTNDTVIDGHATDASTVDEMLEAKARDITEQYDLSRALEAVSPLRIPTIADLKDDREDIQPGDRVLLVVEDDANFAGILLRMARQQGFKVLCSLQGETALELAKTYRPDAITLDLKLIGLDGWTVLDRLKRDPQTRHIPVQVISVIDRDQAAAIGAMSYLEKPVSSEALEGAFNHIKSFVARNIRELLVVEDDDVQRASMIELIAAEDVHVTAVPTGEEALESLKNSDFDCIVLDLSLPEMNGFDVLRQIKAQQRYHDLPVIVYTSKDLSKQEEAMLKKYAVSIISKDATSADRLLDETALFLHRVVAGEVDTAGDGGKHIEPAQNGSIEFTEPPAKGKRKRAHAHNGAESVISKDYLEGRNVLIVDDDVRNIFALTSMLESYGLRVDFAENGIDGVEKLKAADRVDLILMDIMMPEMDGYETMQTIRSDARFAQVPIIALTAKAMAGDREKCLKAGASDYIPKPVDTEKLVEMIRKWLSMAQAVAA